MQASADYDEKIPERILQEHYLEVSNDVDVVGTVVSDPEIVAGLKYPCCRYRLAVDRKYYIKRRILFMWIIRGFTHTVSKVKMI